ncbi:MAG: PQQ-dependent sugar dehydrogenase [Vicinamibacterales bacterium]
MSTTCSWPKPGSLAAVATSDGTHKGKIVRLRDDGSVPEDNPFVGRAHPPTRSTPEARRAGLRMRDVSGSGPCPGHASAVHGTPGCSATRRAAARRSTPRR